MIARRTMLAAFLAACLGAMAVPGIAAESQVTGLAARHRAGQTMLSWKEVAPPAAADSIAAQALNDLRRELQKKDGNQQPNAVVYRVYRSARPITSLAGLEPVAEVPALSGWNTDYYGDIRPEHKALRYVIEEGKGPIPPGTGICAYNPAQAGRAYYAVTVVRDGKENKSLGPGNALGAPVSETVGLGEPVLQRIEKPAEWQYVKGPTLNYYVRWESPPNCAAMGKPYDYVVGIPPKLARPARVGLHLHCWGGSLNGGYGWWYGAEQGNILVASNQIPYDWWTGYHEAYWKGPAEEKKWRDGVVRAYSQTRMLSFLDWVATKWDVDRAGTYVAGSSMGGSGAPMFAIRQAEHVAWAVAWVGVHVPARSPGFKGSYQNVYGAPEWNVKFADGTPVWDYFDDVWYLRNHPEKEIGLITFSNGKNDGGIGWRQAQQFYRALQDTHRPHIFVWGQSGHGQRAQLPVTLNDRDVALQPRTDQSLPAFTACSLDDRPGNGDPADGDPKGQVNLYLAWSMADVVDRPDRWETTVYLVEQAPQDTCTVNITPRRLQQLKLAAGEKVAWSNTPASGGAALQTGQATTDATGHVTLDGVRVGKGKSRVRIERIQGARSQ
ncbi:MAG: alpha/beta hydrolase family protein [Pirellulales bacterium]